jgi:hypothetical protein
MQNKNDFEKIEMPILSTLLNLYEETHLLVLTFPKHERYSLGEKIQDAILLSIEFSILANISNKFEKEKILLRLNTKVELLKILFRVCLNCKFIDMRKYLEMQTRLQEIGKMTQGWVKYARNIT